METGDHDAGHSLRCSAIRVACQSSRLITIVAIKARIRSASPRWLPSNRLGFCTLRIHSAAITPASTSTQKMSTSSAYQPWWPSHGSVSCLSTIPISAIRIVGSEHQEPPEDERVQQPRAESLEQLALPEDDLGLVASAARHVARALSVGARPLYEPGEQADAGDEQRAAHAQSGGQRHGGDGRSYPPFTFLISAEIAGTTSWRSPITA